MVHSGPLVSVIIPLFNREQLVVETIESLIKQTYRHWEAIIVDDCSVDNSYSVVEEIAQKERRIKLFKRHREPKGGAACRNVGLEKSGGKYLMFLDSDDLLAETSLEKRVKMMNKHKHCDFLVFQSVLFKKTPGNWNRLPNILSKKTSDLDRFLNVDYPWNISSMFIETSFLKKHSIYFHEGLVCHQDLDFGVKMIVADADYLKFDDIQDVYIRMDRPDKLSHQRNTFTLLRGKIDFIDIVIDTLRQKNKLDAYYTQKIFNLSVYYASIFLREKHYGLFFKMIELLYRKNIITKYFGTLAAVYSYYLGHPKRKSTLVEKCLNRFFRIIKRSVEYENIPPIDSTLVKYHVNYLKILNKNNYDKILVLGYPKSGNTWVCLLLNYVVGGEFIDMDNSAYTRDALSERRKNGSNFVQPDKKSDKFVLKTHKRSDEIERLSEYSKVICVVRDPKDIIISYYYFRYYFQPYKRSGRTVMPEYAEREKRKNFDATIDLVTRKWKTFMKAALQANNVIYLKYEQLHQSPKETITRCLEDFEIPNKPELIDEAICAYDFQRMTGRKKGAEEIHNFFRKGVVGDYKNYLSQKQIEKINTCLYNELVKLKYLHDSISN